MRWELNDLARRLDKWSPDLELLDSLAIAYESSGSELSQCTRRILEAIESLPETDRGVFSLIRIQGLTHSEAAEIIFVSTKTIQRQLNRSLLLLTRSLTEFQLGGEEK